MREEIELAVYSGVGLLVLEHLAWWALQLRDFAAPWPRAALPALTTGVGMALTIGALIVLQTLIVFQPEHVEHIRQYIRPMVVGGVLLGYLSHRWWRSRRG